MASEAGDDSGLPVYTWQRVADTIAAQIADGTYPPGSRLPGELALADEHKVAQGTIRRALTELRNRGLVHTLPAKGTFVIRSR